MFPIHQNQKLFLHLYDLQKWIDIAHIMKADLGPWSPKKVRTPTCPMLLRPNTIYKWDPHYEQAVRKTASFFRFRNNLGEMGFYRETMDFLVFAIGYWSSHWNGMR